jgi:hypothetical protein
MLQKALQIHLQYGNIYLFCASIEFREADTMTRRVLFFPALALAFSLTLCLPGCGPEDVEETTARNTSRAIETTDFVTSTTEIFSTTEESTAITATTQETTAATLVTVSAVTTVPGESTTLATTAAALGFDPQRMEKAELIRFFNDAANEVRSKRPKITGWVVNQITSLKAGVVPEALTRPIIKALMPGDREDNSAAKGAENSDVFLAEEKAYASKLREGDVTSYKVAKSGANYVITLNIKNHTNPPKGDVNAYGRVFDFQTPRQLKEELGSMATVDEKNVQLNYHDGYVTMTVNSSGKVVKTVSDFQVKAYATDAKIAVFKVNVEATQHSHVECNVAW